jgi:Flp pilus assembly protein TadG
MKPESIKPGAPENTRKGNKRRGTALIEFMLIGIPVIFVSISTVEASIAMWQFHSMMYADETAARYAAMHGKGCTQNGNTCTITVGTVATIVANQAPSLDTSKLNLKLTTSSGSTTCNPISTCLSNSTQFPTNTDNAVGNDVKLVATYPVTNPVALFWPGSNALAGGSFTLGATTRQRIVF